MPGKQSKITFRLLKSQSEKVECARVFATSEPWKKLHRDTTVMMQTISDPIYEVHGMFLGIEPVGYCILQMKGAFTGYLKNIVIRSEWRHQKMGTRMINYIEKTIFVEHPNVFLCVSSFNHKAKAFYENLGYELIGELTNFIVEGHSEFLFRKSTGPINSFEQ